MSTTKTDWSEMLEACETVEQLRAYAEALYASGELDESEQMPAAPWEFPATAEELWSNGEDLLVRLRSGEVAYWSNTDREWSEASIDRIASLRALDLVVVEQMPEWLCGSHDAAHNYGCYPANGAERSIMPRRDAEALCDDDSYDHIVRDARDSDLGRYGRIVV